MTRYNVLACLWGRSFYASYHLESKANEGLLSGDLY